MKVYNEIFDLNEESRFFEYFIWAYIMAVNK